jgi:hypothetical protein
MAGTSTDFDAAGFVTSIRATMRMGMPQDAGERLTFHWERTQTFEAPDEAGDPYDWAADPVTDAPGDVVAGEDGELQVDYAIEFAAGSDQDNVFGSFDVGKAVVTLLGEDYQKIKSADWATIAGVRYDIEFVSPPLGLFEVTVYQMHLTAADVARSTT